MSLGQKIPARKINVGVLLLLPAFFQSAFAATLVVPTDFATIQSAIDAAAPGDLVLVEPGTYQENLSLRSGVDVRGREAARTWLRPNSAELPTVRIEQADDSLLANFTLVDADIAVRVSASVDVQITSVIFDGAARAAVAADVSSIVDVTNNVFYANAVAIQRSTPDVQITNNIFRNNDVTISSQFAPVDNHVNVANNCWSNNRDLLVGGIDGSYGMGAVTGNPQFVDTTARDFHLQQGSPCIDIGQGIDIIDFTVADAGAYGGQLADAVPFPVAGVALSDASTTMAPTTTNIDVSWSRNESYLVTNSVLPGGYRVHYKQNASGPPYDGTDAEAGTAPSPIDAGDTAAFTLADVEPSADQLSAPRLRTAEGVDAAVALTWEAVAGAGNYRVHYGIESTDENEVDAGNVTRFKVLGLENGVTYRFSVGALSQAIYYVAVTAVDSTQNRNESDYSAEQSIAVGPVTESLRSNELIALPELIRPYPPLPDKGGCFIATAAYGSDWAAEVLTLRDFRDRYLLTNAPGRFLVARYYELSPPLADLLRERPHLRALVRWLLTPVVVMALFMLAAPPGVEAVLLALMLGLGISMRRRRKMGRPGPVARERLNP